MAGKKFDKALATVAAKGPNQTEATRGGGEREIPEAGSCLLRFVGYVEVGQAEKEFQGKKKTQNEVILTFELVSKKHPPRVTDDGVVIPQRITVTENLSTNEKARFFKLFRVMNWEGKATHMAQLLGEPFAGTIVHKKGVKDPNKVYANLYDHVTGSWTIRPPRVEETDPETGEPTGKFKRIKVGEAVGEQRLFLWDFPDLEQWASIFIEGDNNFLQDRVKAALNFPGSPAEAMLKDEGGDLDAAAEAALDEEDAAEAEAEEFVEDDDALAGIA